MADGFYARLRSRNIDRPSKTPKHCFVDQRRVETLNGTTVEVNSRLLCRESTLFSLRLRSRLRKTTAGRQADIILS